MLVTKGYGFTPEMIDWSSPADMNPYIKAHNAELKEKDYLAWLSNQYTLSAVLVAVEHNLYGRKSKSNYIKKPLLQELEEKNKPISENELQKQRELFVAKLQVLKTNFELNHKN